MRFLTAILLAGLLAACAGAGDASPSEVESLPDLFSPSIEESAEESADASPDASMDATSDGAMAMDCADAFDELAAEDVDSLSDLTAVTDELDDTIEACDSVEEWLDEAEQRLPDVDLTGAESFLEARCEEAELSDSLLCAELTS
jgi:flagellin-like hook-associated protein FlgL